MEKLKWISIGIAVIYIVIVVVLNLEVVKTDLLFMKIEMPRAALLFITLTVGYLAGMVIGNPLRLLRGKKD